MVFHSLDWFFMGPGGFLWSFMVLGPCFWFSKVQGWFFMVPGGFLGFFKVPRWFLVVPGRYLWFFKVTD